MKERIKWISHKGKEILFLDYSSLKSDKVIELLLEIEKFYDSEIIQKEKKNILILSDITDARIFGESLAESKRVIKKFRQYSKKSAMVGLSAAKTILLSGINLFAGENKASKQFSSIEQAKDYLVS